MQYVGIPYKPKGRSIEGCDCYGLVKLFLSNELGITIDDYDYSSINEAGELIEKGCGLSEWKPIQVPTFGDVVVLRQMKRYSHVGVMVDDAHFIHCEEDIGTVKVAITDPRWSRRIGGYYRHNDACSVAVVSNKLIIGEREVRMVKAGSTLHDIVESVTDDLEHVTVLVCGREVPMCVWRDSIVKDHAVVNINVTHHGDARSILRTVLTMAVLSFAGGAGGTFINRLIGIKSTSALIGIGKGIASAIGIMAINALVPPAATNFARESGTGQTNIYSIAGARNRLNLYGAVPLQLGKHRVYPPYAVKPYTKIKGDDQYIYMIFAIRYCNLPLGLLLQPTIYADLHSLNMSQHLIRFSQPQLQPMYMMGCHRRHILQALMQKLRQG